MRTLVLDIESSPHTVYTFGLFDQNVGISQIEKPTEMMCFAAGWEGEREIKFYSTYHDGRREMVQAAHDLLSEADAVVTYNGDRYDLPHLNREFLLAGLKPPAPYASIDLLKTVRRQFKHASNKLDWVAQQLGVGQKVTHEGFGLWLACMNGDPAAWERMRRYNVGDIRITKGVYRKILPWIQPHPSVSMYDGNGKLGCPNCGGLRVERRGYARTNVSTFIQYHCLNERCGKWYRGTSRVSTTETRGL